MSVVAMDRREPRVDQISARALAIGVGAALCGAVLVALTRDLGPGRGGRDLHAGRHDRGGQRRHLGGDRRRRCCPRWPLPWIEQPANGFQFEQLRDVIASVVFLAIAAVVGLVVGNAAAERRRATEREREARLLALLSSKLLSGDVPDRVLDEFVALLLDAVRAGDLQRPSGARRAGDERDRAARGRRAGRPDRDRAGRDRDGPLGDADDRAARARVVRSRGASASSWRRRRARRRWRWTVPVSTRARGSPSSTPRPTSCVRRCSPRSRTTCARRSRRSRPASRACSTPRPCTTRRSSASSSRRSSRRPIV